MLSRKLLLGILSYLGVATVATADPYGTSLGEFNGVNIYSNGSPDFVSSEYNTVGSVNTGMKWQCVEFVRRYYLQFYKVDLRSLCPDCTNANTWYGNAGQMRLTQFPNGSKAKPQVGDIIVSNGGSFGHIAIASAVSDSRICVVQQNFNESTRDANGEHCMNLSGSSSAGYTIDPFDSGGTYRVQGWLRPLCDPTRQKCGINYSGSIGWYPKTNLCQNATQWFNLGTEGGDPVFLGTTTRNACPLVCPVPNSN